MTGGTDRRSRVGFGVALAVGLGLVVWAVGSPPQDGEPLDPRSSGELGARGLVLFLRELGADTRITGELPTADDDVLVVLEDRYGGETRDGVVDWVVAGGTLVVADPLSPLAPATVDPSGLGAFGLEDEQLSRGDCDIDALEGADTVTQAVARYEVDPAAASCFGDGTAAYVVVEPKGAGTVVAIGGPTGFTNQQLDQHDHAVVAGSLMAPTPGTSVVLAERPPIGDGDTSLADLVAPGVKAALIQLGVAFAVYALFRARRFGRPVAEPLPVQIAGSELVTAVGRLLQQSKDPGRAAAMLSADLRRLLGSRLGLGADADAHAVAQAASARTGVDEARIAAALSPGPVEDEQALVDTARTIESVTQEVLHGHPPD